MPHPCQAATERTVDGVIVLTPCTRHADHPEHWRDTTRHITVTVWICPEHRG